MTYADLSPWANHLWQSTLFAGAVWLFTLALRKNRAAARYWLWLAASVKFLIPFSLLVSFGSQLGWRFVPITARPELAIVVTDVSQPFSVPYAISPMEAASRDGSHLPVMLLAIWLSGVVFGCVFWARLLRQIRALRRSATRLNLNVPIPVLLSSARLEPAVFGILNPVLVLPAGLVGRLTPAQLEAVLAHELCHFRRKDNLTAAIHMAVETVFWFYPVVWWIRRQLLAERERACDEHAVQAVKDPRAYADAILSVCKFHVEWHSICVSGMTGGDLKRESSVLWP